MSGDQDKAKQIPLWGLVVLTILFCVAGFPFGVELGRDIAVSQPEIAASVDQDTRLPIYGSLAFIAGLFIWLGLRKDRS